MATSLLTVLVLSMLMGLTHEQYVTMLPKSITTAIGMGVSEELGGYVTITVAVIVVTGVIGNILAEFICNVFKITEPIAKGVAIGTSAHAVGTAKAIEMGEIEGAMSSLSIAVAGILTVIGASVFANIINLAKEKGIYDKFPYFFSEIPVNALMHTISDDEGDILLSESRKALYPLIGDENCVIIGRCANYAFSDRQDKISIFLSGDKSDRIRHIAKKHDFSEKKAKAVVDETDSRRREFHKYCSNQEWGNADFYDLCIDETKAGVDGTVDVIKKYIEIMA